VHDCRGRLITGYANSASSANCGWEEGERDRTWIGLDHLDLFDLTLELFNGEISDVRNVFEDDLSNRLCTERGRSFAEEREEGIDGEITVGQGRQVQGVELGHEERSTRVGGSSTSQIRQG
jgi:hypothetical protein